MYHAAHDSVHRDVWLGVTHQEFQRRTNNNTFATVELSAGRWKPISAKWVFTWKRNHNGEVVQLKA